MNSFNSFPNSTSSAQLAARQRLEQLWQASLPVSVPASNTPWYHRFGQWLVQVLTDSDQIRVWTKITPNGTQWCAYDPQLDRRFAGYSEADLRTWLEQRYR
jgi:hypothetical protein